MKSKEDINEEEKTVKPKVIVVEDSESGSPNELEQISKAEKLLENFDPAEVKNNYEPKSKNLPELPAINEE